MLYNLPLVKHIDDVRVLNGRQAMCDGDGGTALGSGVQRGLYDAFGRGIEGGCGFVQEALGNVNMAFGMRARKVRNLQNFRIAEQCAGDGDALALAT